MRTAEIRKQIDEEFIFNIQCMQDIAQGLICASEHISFPKPHINAKRVSKKGVVFPTT